MRIKLYINKSVHENAALYYEAAKEARRKIAGLEAAIKETERELESAGREISSKKPRIRRKKEWHEKFHWFRTSGGKLAIGGRSAQQNDLVFSRHMEENDLFFHADIQGGSAVVLKDGVNASEQELLEAAQFAACFSKAWINANASVDVYHVGKSQVSKHAAGGYIPTGAFAIAGKRTWYRGTVLALRAGMLEGRLAVLPDCSKSVLENAVRLLPSKTGTEKGGIAKKLSKRFGAHPDELLETLPNGRGRIIEGITLEK